jgi:hypothetical protein
MIPTNTWVAPNFLFHRNDWVDILCFDCVAFCDGSYLKNNDDLPFNEVMSLVISGVWRSSAYTTKVLVIKGTFSY